MKIKPLLILILAIVDLLFMVGGLFFVYKNTLYLHKAPAKHEQFKKELESFEKKIRTSDPVVFSMESINTNLSSESKRTIRIKINLEMLNQEGFEEVTDQSARVKDTILRILSDTDYDNILSLQGKLSLKNEIMDELNLILKKSAVQDVFFSDFAIQ